MKRIIGNIFYITLISCGGSTFLENGENWIIERGNYSGKNLNYSDSLVAFYNDVFFQNGKIYYKFTHIDSTSNKFINYELGKQITPFVQQITIWGEGLGTKEKGYLLIDNIENGIDKNRCLELIIQTESLELYLWRSLDNIFIPSKFGTNDLDLNMIPISN